MSDLIIKVRKKPRYKSVSLTLPALERQFQTFLSWLTPIDPAAQQNNHFQQRQSGTGVWLLNSPQYASWVGGECSTLFCPGIPGAGKTILTSVVVEDLWKRFGRDQNIGVAYLYCDYKNREQQTTMDLIAILLKQLIRKNISLPDSIHDLYKRHEERKTRPSLEEISQSLSSVIGSFSRAFIVVDALDELSDNDGTCFRLLSELFRVRDSSPSRVGLFATSRYIPHITDRFRECTKLDIRANDDDMSSYLWSHVPTLPSCVSEASGLDKEIIAEVVKTANGM